MFTAVAAADASSPPAPAAAPVFTATSLTFCRDFLDPSASFGLLSSMVTSSVSMTTSSSSLPSPNRYSTSLFTEEFSVDDFGGDPLAMARSPKVSPKVLETPMARSPKVSPKVSPPSSTSEDEPSPVRSMSVSRSSSTVSLIFPRDMSNLSVASSTQKIRSAISPRSETTSPALNVTGRQAFRKTVSNEASPSHTAFTIPSNDVHDVPTSSVSRRDSESSKVTSSSNAPST